MPTPTSSQLVGNRSYMDTVAQLLGSSLDTSQVPYSSDIFRKVYLANEGFSSDSNCEVELYGGPNLKILEIPNNATAFSHRDTLFTFELYGYSSATIP
ncbi:hypothetical protein EV360DRAFT_83943 [Lentinula raphanica]|nr:hypothetical protein EV360DRAFT_83943 [Lentinula raphanica]